MELRSGAECNTVAEHGGRKFSRGFELGKGRFLFFFLPFLLNGAAHRAWGVSAEGAFNGSAEALLRCPILEHGEPRPALC